MAFVIPDNLPSSLLPIAWMIGRWEGFGHLEDATDGRDKFRQVVEFTNDGEDFLQYSSRSWLVDDEDRDDQPLASEVGYWRVRPSEEEAPRIVEVEFLVTHPTGFAEVYAGTAGEGKAELATESVTGTATALTYTRATRLYGHVQGSLLWVLDIATGDVPLASHSSAQLRRVES